MWYADLDSWCAILLLFSAKSLTIDANLDLVSCPNNAKIDSPNLTCHEGKNKKKMRATIFPPRNHVGPPSSLTPKRQKLNLLFSVKISWVVFEPLEFSQSLLDWFPLKFELFCLCWLRADERQALLFIRYLCFCSKWFLGFN